ncbi:uncharacterized protein PHACADRAFT_148630 [Phanerochaete carnosa HHB-10118-sp]|uniref:Ribosomal RNA small subunit methyltransferase NEP1 n=1 Tax=Phanerochaete carnosa (strain HHB-10118-sp) TaxID=650164 RepID=K5VQV2_PHACS|nr:uncharacterized protein PHACADRAFT_148630 [Phanerochaete carnosa HHB-10118-sp]EKM53818.1 hypothetical protein PHACADRAFT_148630 [Phanerochaete carnosa HHB-10118-sp]
MWTTHQNCAGENVSRRPLYVVLERASVELCHVPPPPPRGRYAKQKPTLLTCDDHQSLLVRMGREISDARPDISHQCLLTLLDSPLNKAGLLKVFIHTTQDLLIAVHPDVRIPRTYRRYSGLMVQLLQQGENRGASDSQVLMHILDHAIARHLPPDTLKLGESHYARTAPRGGWCGAGRGTRSLALFVGAHAKGTRRLCGRCHRETVSLGSYAVSASVVCGKVCCAMEDLLGIE